MSLKNNHINLLIDIGNTNTKYSFIPANTKWKDINFEQNSEHKIHTFHNSIYEEINKDIHGNIYKLPIIDCLSKLSQDMLQNSEISIYISNVSKPEYSEIIKNYSEIINNIKNIQEYKTKSHFKNLINNYDDYTKLGVDRWLAMIAGHGLSEHAYNTTIVIGCGSATTLDIIHNNKFIGGYIIPSISYMQQSLLQNTARINNSYEEQELENFYTSPSTNTSSCINNGIIISQISFIEKSIFSFIKTQDIVEYNCIIYGGYAKKISKFLSLPHVVFNNMVMLGLARVLND
ncbi:MAG: hypothetical protein RLZZ210_98 [Pseudomonadota bacterium]|jgi:type III pantothenate kinase